MSEREELIEEWMVVAATVFHAEDAISDVWFPKLKKAKDVSSEERWKISQDYLRAIATYLVDRDMMNEIMEVRKCSLMN